MIVGTFSSVFLATPLEVSMRGGEARIARHTAEVLEDRARLQGREATPATVAAGVAPSAHVVPGHHLGTAAQPKRKRTDRR